MDDHGSSAAAAGRRRASVLGVIGAAGGIGAAALAAWLAAAGSPSALVDLDHLAGGIDVRLGLEAEPGPRWSQVRVAGGRLDGPALRARLPAWGGVPVLAADVRPPLPALAPVVAALAEGGRVVLALAGGDREVRDRGAGLCGLAVLLAEATVIGLSAAAALRRELSDVRLGLVLGRGEVSAGAAARLVGVPLIGRLPRLHRLDQMVVRPGRRPPRPAARLVDGLVARWPAPAPAAGLGLGVRQGDGARS